MEAAMCIHFAAYHRHLERYMLFPQACPACSAIEMLQHICHLCSHVNCAICLAKAWFKGPEQRQTRMALHV